MRGNNQDLSRAGAAVDRSGGPESLYVFEYRDGDDIRATPPSELPDDEAARQEALRSAQDLLDPTLEQEGWAVRARTSDGREICVVSFEEARESVARQVNPGEVEPDPPQEVREG